MVVDYADTNKKSSLDQHKGTRILGGQTKTYFLSNLTTLHQTKPQFGAKLSGFVTILTKNAAM